MLQDIYDYVEDFLDSDEWMEDDLMLTSSSHDGLRSPPPYSLQSAAFTDFNGHTYTAPVSHTCMPHVHFSSKFILTENIQRTGHCRFPTVNRATMHRTRCPWHEGLV